MSRIRVAAALCLAATLSSAGVAAQQNEAEWRDPYRVGDPALYPAPEAIDSVPRAADLGTDPSLAAIPADARPRAAGENSSVRIELMDVIRGAGVVGTSAPEGMEAVVLVTRWTNIRPRERVERSKLEGKADRTFGAGGLFSGGGAGDSAKDTVEIDVPYKVPKPVQHAFLLAGGMATDMRAEGAALPGGLMPDEAFTISRNGQPREVRLAFFVPKGAEDLAFRLFDYANGHITLAVAGDHERALASPDLSGKPSGALPGLAIAVTGLGFEDRYLGQEAPEGWRFALVGVVGRGESEPGRMGSIASVEPTRAVWLAGDAGAVAWALPPETGARAISFTPEFYQAREFAFLVHNNTQRFRLGLRGQNSAISLAVTEEPPAPMPAAAVSHADGKVAEISVLGLRWESDFLVADLGISAQDGTKGVELNLSQQFLLTDPAGTEIRPDLAATRRLTHRPPTPAVVPPGTPMRFDLAFPVSGSVAPTMLRYRGFSGEASLDLSGVAIAGERGVATAEGTTDFPEFAIAASPSAERVNTESPEANVAAETAAGASGGAPSRLGPPKEAPRLMPVTLPEFDPASAIAETEPNDKSEQATPLGPGRAATGTMAGKDEDWFLLQVEGEPQLWTIEASGPAVKTLSVIRAGGKRVMERRIAKNEPSIRIDNVFLLPGPYWLHLRASADGGTYALRAVNLGRPDRYAEFEPNDTSDVAHVLRFGQPRRGLIDDVTDKDLYRFSLDRPTHLVVSVTPPPQLPLLVRIEGGSWKTKTSGTAASGQVIRYEGLLDAADYEITLAAEGKRGSDTPYEVRLDRLDPFELPVDLEPNDESYQARRLGGWRRFAGRVGEFGGVDWYRLPQVSHETALTLTLEGDDKIRPVLSVQDGDVARSAKLSEDRKQRSGARRVFRGELPPGANGLLQISGVGDYRIEMAYDPEPDTAATDVATPAGSSRDASVAIALSGSTPDFGAYRDDVQEAPVSLSVTNRSNAPQKVELLSAPAEAGWDVALKPGNIELEPGESRKIEGIVRALPDRPVRGSIPIFLRAQNEEGAGVTTTLQVAAACDAPLISPRRYEPLPASMLGGLNLAWTALGGDVVAESDSARRNYEHLLDGLVPINGRFDISGRAIPFELTVRLAGESPAEVAGVTIYPRSAGGSQSSLGPFEILASEDGNAFSPVYSGYVEHNDVEQAFAFESRVQASHIRLRLLRADPLDSSGKIGLGQWKVIASPGSRPFGDQALNIADPALGGHLVWASWEAGYRSREAMLTEKADVSRVGIEPLQPIEWVVGFHHERAARIARIAWRDVAEVPDRARRFDAVKISVSTTSPTGPWEPVTDWTLERDEAGKAELVLPGPVWARFVRFSAPGSDKKTQWSLPEMLQVFEQREGDGYLSILGEWGHYAREAAFERASDVERSFALEDKGGPGPDAATLLAVDSSLGGRVQVGRDEDWFRIEAPDGMDRLEFSFDGTGAKRLIPTLQDAAGTTVKLVEGDESNGARIFHASVAPGESYFLRVREARRSIMIAWDNSGSVSAYHATMYRAITRFVDDIRPELEVVNLLPFRDGSAVPLLNEWSDDPVALKAAIGAYDRSDGSSESEKTLIGAMEALSSRPGNRGIVFLTDANSGGDRIAARMWQLFREVRPRVFTMELQIQAKGVDHFQDLMQDWAAVNDGRYNVFRSQDDLDVAFDRAACLMRRPAEYRVSLRRGPGTGKLRVAWEEGKDMAGATVELILDASGSMRSRKNKVDGRLKIDVAKDVMSEIIGLLPADSQVGLRVYGHRKKEGTRGDCQDSQLVVRIGDLDRKRLLSAVKNIKALGTTPIAYSLEQAGKDMARVEGPKLIVLVTDGKEECKADPAGTVTQLRADGIDVRVDIVGFALAEQKVKEDMRRAAAAGGGRFFDAQNRDALAAAIRNTLAMPFEVLDGRDRPVATGLTGENPAELYQGDYSVIVRTAKGDVTVRDVRIAEGQSTDVLLAREEDGIRVSVSAPRPR